MENIPVICEKRTKNDAQKREDNNKAVKKYRLKKALDDSDFKKRESKRIESARKKKVEKLDENAKALYRLKAAERKRKSRENKAKAAKAQQAATPEQPQKIPYQRPQSFGKALNKSLRNLPNSPNKSKLVVAGLARHVGLKIHSEMMTGIGGKKKLDEKIETEVEHFYFRPDVSYTMPGMGDEMTVWKDGVKMKYRKYHLMLFLREAHQIYLELNPELVVGFSKFCELRPVNVLLLEDTPAYQCKCKIHENLFLRLKALNIAYDTFWDNALCNSELNSPCWQGICATYSCGQKVSSLLPKSDTIQYRAWVDKIIEVRGENGELKNHKNLVNDLKEACVGEVEDGVRSDWMQILNHVHTKRIQANEFEKDKADPTKRVLQIDFAMKYSCEYQNEIQSALWSRKSVALFTAATAAGSRGQF